jgi:hypothetical protein
MDLLKSVEVRFAGELVWARSDTEDGLGGTSTQNADVLTKVVKLLEEALEQARCEASSVNR